MSLLCATAVIIVLLLVSCPGRSVRPLGGITGGSQLVRTGCEPRPDFVRNNNYCILQVMTSLAPLLNGMAGRQAPGWPSSRYRAGLGQNRHAAAIPELGLDAARIAWGGWGGGGGRGGAG